MLRCPKCSRIYQTGSQRFCTHDGGRLLSISELNANHQAPEINFNNSQNHSDSNWQPRRPTGRLVLPPQIQIAQNGFGASSVGTTERAEINVETQNNNGIVETEILEESFELKKSISVTERRPTGRLVLPNEIPDSFAPTGDRSVRPSGRLPFTAQNVAVFIGQNIKGRYTVDKILKQNAESVVYLAHDRLGEHRQVSVKIWFEGFEPETAAAQRFYEERGALSHLIHPNIARVLDSGELTEGKPFIIGEYPEGLTLREAMQISGKFSKTRASRVVRQIAQALSEAHNSRVLHRNLKPENIVSNTTEGNEQIKVLNFGVLGDENEEAPEMLAYAAPERLIGQLAHVEGDIFSLGVIAFEILTGQKPFLGETIDDVLDAQEFGLAVKPSNLRKDLSDSVDRVLTRALAFNRGDRFHHAREFGEALSDALNETETVAPAAISETGGSVQKGAVTISESEPQSENAAASIAVSEAGNGNSAATTATVRVVQAQPAQKKKTNWIPVALGLLGLLLVIGAFAFSDQLFTRKNSPANQPQPTEQKIEQPVMVPAPQSIQPEAPQTENNAAPTASKNSVPENFVLFESSKADYSGKLEKNYVPFSLFYPREWQFSKNHGKAAAANFLDISNRLPNKLPLEQLIVNWYESGGTFERDRKIFPNLTKKLITAYAKAIPEFAKISEGETKFKGRDVYEVKFTGKSVDERGEPIQIWGRTIFIPVEKNNAKSGLALTMVATSLAPNLTGVDDVGEKGELARILPTFEISSKRAKLD